jgi:hypothetical protein
MVLETMADFAMLKSTITRESKDIQKPLQFSANLADTFTTEYRMLPLMRMHRTLTVSKFLMLSLKLNQYQPQQANIFAKKT